MGNLTQNSANISREHLLTSLQAGNFLLITNETDKNVALVYNTIIFPNFKFLLKYKNAINIVFCGSYTIIKG